MATVGVIHFIIIFVVLRLSFGKPDEHDINNRELCKMFSRNPFFGTELVVGKPWRVYYTWNVNLGSKCLDLIFKNATKTITQRIWSDMNEYLEHQPNWDAAALLMYVGTARHEALLFTDQGPAGSFVGVPNVAREGNIPPLRKSMTLLKFQMKLIRGKYLLVIDCITGAITLSARQRDVATSRSDIATAAADLELGKGYPACTKETNNHDY
ncbi:unnamed protein product [Parnassius mnemosyne]|uniref:Uncharacterized protein n=1 Tax=Parnassius mnemosyne TaxID=213953 RepID=A0AAV1L526_9NEOP